MAESSGDGGRRTVLITGASGGIGEAFAHRIGSEGHRLVIVARRDGELHRVAGIIGSRSGAEVLPVALDLTHRDSGEKLQDELGRRGIEPDIVINNAGYGLFGAAADRDRDDQVGIVDLNARAVTDLTLRFLPAMRANGRGGFINVASVAAFLPGPYMAVYYASKAFILSFSEALATELKGTGVTVTCLCPGPVPTGFQARAGMDAKKVYRGVPQVSAKQCAECGWEAFKRGQRVAFPDVAAALSSYTSRHFPRRFLLPIVGMIQNPRRSR
jgi:short-subunit dehydrogenase